MNIVDAIKIFSSTRPDHPALIQEKRIVNFSELFNLILAAASLIKSYGINKGDIVGICLSDRIEHVVSLYAVSLCGASVLPMDVRWVEEERKKITNFFKPNLVLHEPDQEDGILSKTLSVHENWLNGFIDNFLLLNEFPETDKDDPFLLSLSTGTTGVPNGPMLSHKQMESRFITQQKSLTFNSEDIYLSATPIYFGAGRGFVMGMLYNGATVVLLVNPYTTNDFVKAVKEFGITATLVVPTILRRLLSLPYNKNFLLPSLRLLLSTGSILHAEERLDVMKKLSPYLLNYYGSTEGGGVSVLKWDDPIEKSGSVGKPVFGTNLEIVNQNNSVLSDGSIGKIRYSGASVADSFFKNNDTKDAVFDSGWFYPGDLGKFDSDGYLYLVGRVKDIIIRGGVNIYPIEIEEVILSHSDVSDVAVVPWPSNLRGEEIAAFVIKKTTSELNSNLLLEFCGDKLSSYKIPREIFFVKDFPKNSVGKVKKSLLIEQLPKID